MQQLERLCILLIPVLIFFSMTKRMQDGWTLGGNKESIWLTKDGQKLFFDIKISTPKGALFCMYFKRECEMAATAKNCGKKISRNLAHDLTGHINTEESEKTVKYLGYDLNRGGMNPCEACAEAKAKMKNLPTRLHTVDKIVRPRVIPAKPNDLISLDISTIRSPKGVEITVSKPNWRLIIDQRTGMKFSDFFATKNGMIEPTCENFFKWKEAGIPVKEVRCDNAGENTKLEDKCGSAEWKLNIKFGYTARDTPQQNSYAEVAITTILLRSKAMMIAVNVVFVMRYKLFREAITTATL